ncbi:hypothetical protein KEM54_004188, partial [Ascosphaera aggregata]
MEEEERKEDAAESEFGDGKHTPEEDTGDSDVKEEERREEEIQHQQAKLMESTSTPIAPVSPTSGKSQRIGTTTQSQAESDVPSCQETMTVQRRKSRRRSLATTNPISIPLATTADIDIGLQLNDVDFKPSIDAFDDQRYDNANNNNNLLPQNMNGLLPPFNPVGAGVGVGVREFGSFSSYMVTPFAPAYSPQYANLKRHSIAVPAFPQNQMGQMQMLQQNLALRTNPNAALLGNDA